MKQILKVNKTGNFLDIKSKNLFILIESYLVEVDGRLSELEPGRRWNSPRREIGRFISCCESSIWKKNTHKIARKRSLFN